VPANRVELRGVLAGREMLRYSPAGVPILSGLLRHESVQAEAGTDRQVELEIGLVFAGRLAQAADRLALGATLRAAGFLAPKRRQSKQLVLHVTEFESIEV
jgi:primosomal replication protein N